MMEIESEIVDLCDHGIRLISDIYYDGLQHRVIGIESRIFYQKLETDLNRYKLEIMLYHKKQCAEKKIDYEEADQFSKLLGETKALYHKTCEEADVMQPNRRLRLAINVNYAVFLYDIAQLVDEARDVSKKAFDAALEQIDAYDKEELDECLPLMQILKDNYELWASDVMSEAKKRELLQQQQK